MGSNAAVSLSSVGPKRHPLPTAADVVKEGEMFVRDVRLMNYTPNQYSDGEPCYFEYRWIHYGQDHDARLGVYFLGIIEREAATESCNELRWLRPTVIGTETEQYFRVRIEFGSEAMGQLERLEKFRVELEKAFLHSLRHGSHVFDSFR